MVKTKVIRLDRKDIMNIMSGSELVVKLTLKLKKKLERHNIFVDDTILLTILKENLILRLASKSKKIDFDWD
jgi:hypothetical protein